MIGGGIAFRYAKALFELGVEQKNYKKLLKDLEKFSKAYNESDDLRLVLKTPSIRLGQRKEVARAVTKKLMLSPLTSNFVLLLIDKVRINEIESIYAAYQSFVDEQEGIVRADVTSAQKLDSAQVTRLGRVLGKMTGKKVEIETSEDPDLIGGVIARIGGQVYDGSLRSQLRALRQAAIKEM